MMTESKGNTINLQRTFMIGDKWLYYKIYSGPKTADIILTQIIKPLTEKLLSEKIIDKWFFIRYADPKPHIRVRFQLSDNKSISIIIREMNEILKSYLDQDLIWKIQIDTYHREVERYGVSSMEMSETLFFHESKMIVDVLDKIRGDEGERIRWLFGLKAVDSLLDDFSYSMENKFELVTNLRENFGREHNMNRMLKEQMEKKFRKDRKIISNLLGSSEEKESNLNFIFESIKLKSQSVNLIAKKIRDLYDNDTPDPFFNNLISSYSHMLINRLFKTRQRTHELVLYDFLHRYYKSEIARKKYSGINKKKVERNYKLPEAVTV